MNKSLVVLFFFIALLNVTSFAQDWSVFYTPRFRLLRDVHVVNPEKIVVVGGNPFNDSITYMATTSNKGVDWFFNDIFPGRQMNTLFFKNNNVGICAGDNQALYKTDNTGETWQLSSWGIALSNRDINKLFDGQYGSLYAAGGLDNINGFLLKSVDGGSTWQNIKEWPDNELRTAFSPIHNNIVVAGYSGFMQLSSDDGETWQDCVISEIGYVPEFTDIDFIDENIGFCTGGKRGIDSTSLILKTINGGNNWTIAYSTTGACLNDISMATSQIIYAVGDYGKVIKSIDAGETWNDEIIEGNPQVDYYSVEFLNPHIGAISGQWGYVMIFDDGETNLPEVQTIAASEIQNQSAVLNAIVNPGFTQAQVYLVYGIDENLDTEISVGNFYGGEMQNVSFNLQGLEPNNRYSYYAKIVSNYGEYLGSIKSFYTGNPLPNWDFENWHTVNYSLPSYWFMHGNVEEYLTFGSGIVELKPIFFYENNQTKASAIINFDMEVDSIDGEFVIVEATGGFPISEKPLVFNARLKYDIEPSDSALILVVLETNNVLISENWFYIKGNSSGSFEDLSFDLDYSIDQIPDTVMIGITNSNPANEDQMYNSTVEIDSIWFEGSDISIPNSGFSDWINKTVEYPDNWHCEKPDFIKYNEDIINIVSKVEDSYSNDYAICFKSIITESDTAMGEIKPNNKYGSFNINHRHQKLEFYYKYSPDGIDSANIWISLYSNGVMIAGGNLSITSPASLWEKASLDIFYFDPNLIPDSATLIIQSTKWENQKVSELCIDKIAFDGDYIPVEQNIVQTNIIYPNPTKELLYFNEPIDSFKIYNNKGELIQEYTDVQQEINIQHLPSGIYMYEIKSANRFEKNRFIKL